MPEWYVALSVCGPISVRRRLFINVEKGYDLPFWTNVSISRIYNGVKIEVTARAEGQEEANEAGLFFVGQALDVLSLRTNLPITMFLADSENEIKTIGAKRLVVEQEWEEVFRSGRYLGLTRPAFSRAVSWYRKGLESNNPIDRFMALWTSMESVASQCARQNERTALGIINKICDCFDQLWTDEAHWKVIPSNVAHLNKLYNYRNTITHGAVAIQIENLKEIAHELSLVQTLAFNFLTDAEHNLTERHDHERRAAT